jgi:hypothetical protein
MPQWKTSPNHHESIIAHDIIIYMLNVQGEKVSVQGEKVSIQGE